MDEGALLLERLEGCYFYLFAEPTWAEEFCAIDVRQLRAAALSVNVPPSGVSSTPNVPAVGGEVEVEATYTCMIVNESGEACGRALPDRRALRNHLVSHHGFRALANVVTATNQCCVCLSTFAHLESARRHLAK
eukprot:8444149-Pyramimonas_sp.AAC.1